MLIKTTKNLSITTSSNTSIVLETLQSSEIIVTEATIFSFETGVPTNAQVHTMAGVAAEDGFGSITGGPTSTSGPVNTGTPNASPSIGPSGSNLELSPNIISGSVTIEIEWTVTRVIP